MRSPRPRRTVSPPAEPAGDVIIRLLKQRLSRPDTRTPLQTLRDMRAKQSAGQLANPATAVLLDRLERSIT